MYISEEIKNRIIDLYCNSSKRISQILKEVAPNEEITIEGLYDVLNEYKEKNPDKFKRKQRVAISENELLDLLKSGLIYREIGDKLGITENNVLKRVRKMREKGIEIPNRKKTGKIIRTKKTENDEKDNTILELLEKGLTRREIGEKFGISGEAISKRIGKMRKRGIEISKRKRLRKTENDDKDNEILKLLESGLNQSEIAIHLGVTRAAISLRVVNMRKRGVEIPEKKKTTDNVKNSIEERTENTDIDIAKQIVNLMNTKNASLEQVRIMAKHYGVDKKVEELLKSLDEKER